MLALLLVSVPLGLSNFAAAVGLGVPGVGTRARLRVGLVFGIFEAGLPVLGLLLGRRLAGGLGGAAHWTGGAVLIAIGCYTVLHAVRGQAVSARAVRGGAGQPAVGHLIVAGLALSMDNLAIGFALGTYHVGVLVAALVIGAVSVGLSLLGLELGGWLGSRAGHAGELLAGVLLVAAGVALGSNAL